MEEVVPWVPYLFDSNVNPVSANVQSFSFDQFAGLAALDSMAVPGIKDRGRRSARRLDFSELPADPGRCEPRYVNVPRRRT